jgi:hypothetical protein
MDLSFAPASVAAKPVYLATREPKKTKLMKQQRKWDKVEYVT